TGPGKGTATGTPGMDVSRLFDNNSGTRTLFGTATPFVQYHLNGPVTDKATFYTLTSGPTPGIPGGISDQVVDVTASAENTDGGEVKENLVDGDIGTKWLTFMPTGWAQFKLAQPIAVTRYALTSANDAPTRDPQDWNLQGSQDGVNWTTLDSQSGQSFTDRFTTNEYGFANTTAYLYYRLNITANHGAGLLQLAEVQLSVGPGGGTVADPKSWLLKGSYDGRNWTVIDQRTNEMFRWRLQ